MAHTDCGEILQTIRHAAYQHNRGRCPATERVTLKPLRRRVPEMSAGACYALVPPRLPECNAKVSSITSCCERRGKLR